MSPINVSPVSCITNIFSSLSVSKLYLNSEFNTIAKLIAPIELSEDESKEFLNDLPHKYFDENMLHGLLISEIKDYDLCIKELDEFLPYVDNWAVCDASMNIKRINKNRDFFYSLITKYKDSKNEFEARFDTNEIAVGSRGGKMKIIYMM